MNRQMSLGLAMLAGAAFGALAVNSLVAQVKPPGAYAILDISEIPNPDILKRIVPKAAEGIAAAGGQYIIRTSKITPYFGTPPKRVAVIGFESQEKAIAWLNSPIQKEVNAAGERGMKLRWFIADGALD